ncbi:dienelactone hydrolase family protein [Bradyrhizobium acaciae]|uniref:dienelactone hydrolase family protein n=1 Tax=Bradyrhizobium acaciae TaxID=2683706 RepID=UPI003083F2DC|nr:alpha/beta hydrolase [Bradyrhizobium acaciae]
MIGVRLVLLLAAFAGGAAPSAWADELTETQALFPVSIGGNTFRLEGLIIRKADAPGRLPIALLTNGGAATATGGANATAAAYAHYARDLARRGWLAVVTMRRGFGQSEGPKPVPITCQAASLGAWAGAAADDLQATIDTVAKRPDADPSKVIVIGSEIAGVAAVALSARNPPGLVGVVSVSGGLQSESNCPINDLLVEGYKGFGAKNRVPNLWIYSSSDRLFGPDLAERLHTAFLDAGGDVKFVMFFHDGNVGTAIFGQATEAWYVQMDGFLRANNLPTWRTTEVWSAIDRLKIVDRMERQNFAGSMIQHYLRRRVKRRSPFHQPCRRHGRARRTSSAPGRACR